MQRAIATNEPPELLESQLYRDLGQELERESRALFPGPEERSVIPLEEAATLMGRTVSEVRLLAEARLIYAEKRQDGKLFVEPVVLSGAPRVTPRAGPLGPAEPRPLPGRPRD